MLWPWREAAAGGEGGAERAARAPAREGPREHSGPGGGRAGRGRQGCPEGLGREDNSGREGGTCGARGQVLRSRCAPSAPPLPPSSPRSKMSVMLWRWEQNNTTMKLVRVAPTPLPLRGAALLLIPTPPPSKEGCLQGPKAPEMRSVLGISLAVLKVDFRFGVLFCLFFLKPAKSLCLSV